MITTENPVLASYVNGNCRVAIMGDGTKVREWDGEAAPLHPESIDMKITDYCDAGCPFCHESSTRRGQHGDLATIFAAVDGLPEGVELAIGGGNPLDHPELLTILKEFRRRGLVSNLTVNGDHVLPYANLINGLRNQQLIRGLGVSWTQSCDLLVANPHIGFKFDSNTVWHFIAGVHEPGDARRIWRDGNERWKILVLGYKVFGRGVKHDEAAVARLIAKWKYWIVPLMRMPSVIVSFDNLAIEQLNIREQVTPETWERCYMGDDGKFTMYVDAVKKEFAVSSTSPRQPIMGRSIFQMFKSL